MYVQCTSPLRRYLDLLAQRQIISRLTNKSLYSEYEFNEYIKELEKPSKQVKDIMKGVHFRLSHMIFSIPNRLACHRKKKALSIKPRRSHSVEIFSNV